MAVAIVTGATGLVGYNTVVALLAKQYEVYALGRNEQKLADLRLMGARTVRIDITQDRATWEELPKYAHWFHCAAAVSGATQEQLVAVNIEGTRKLVEHFFALEGKHFVHISSISVYSLNVGRALQEIDATQPKSIYGQSKLQAEQIVVTQFAEQHAKNYTILRPPFICGPRDQNFVHELAKRLQKHSFLLINRDSLIGIVDARDLTDVMINACSDGKFAAEIINVQGHAISFHQFVKLIATVTHLPKPRKPLPYTLALLLGTLNEFVKAILHKNADKGLSRYRIRSLTTNRYLNTEKLQGKYEFLPIPLQRSLEDWWMTSTLNKECM